MASVLHQKPFLYVNGEIVSFAHELVIITTQTDLWPFATSRYQQFYINSQYWANASATVSLQHDKVTEIKNLIKDMQADNLIGQLDSVQIETLLRQAKTNEPYAEHAIRKAFKHQFRLAPEGQAITQWLNQRLPKSKANVATDCEQFDKHVLDKIVESLKTNPYVFVMGDSGVGKTTFISKYLKPHYQRYYGRKINLFIGEDSLSDYIVAPKNELNILFLDEANIEKDGYWDRFEALFYKISGIADLIFHQLDPQNFKFIFAGNQSSTHGRNPHRFFNRHGHVRVFPHFPDFYLAERIILPLLKNIA
ncbi:MAG: hypothetical protein HWD59_10250 [Coxiellaceae bacterium]|nr:MAG: hypothetical protein HWD59_10250 [Coxiellaceae bacterium]